MKRFVILTGGSASNALARAFELGSTDEITHVVPVFDNGGSTGALRKVTNLPAMGDIRNRLCALSQSTDRTTAQLRELFSLRLSNRKSEKQLRHELRCLTSAVHYATGELPDPERTAVVSALRDATASLPEGFRLSDLSIGNLLLIGAHMQLGSFIGAIDWARKLLRVRSRVLPTTLASVHLAAFLETGQWLTGQSDITSEKSTLRRRIRRVVLIHGDDTHTRTAPEVPAAPELRAALSSADAIVYGFGSFYTSILPHLLVDGVAAAIGGRSVPKCFLVNPTADRETECLTVASMLTALRSACRLPAELTSLVTHAVCFSPDPALAIPQGDLSSFTKAGGAVLVEGAPASFEDIAFRASAIVRSVAGAPVTVAEPAKSNENAVVLFDLDHTLFDYQALRRDASIAAFAGLCARPRETADILLREMTSPVTELLCEWGFPNLRRQWNCAAVYAWAKVIDRTPADTVASFFAALRAGLASLRNDSSFMRRRQLYRIALALNDVPEVRSLIRRAREIDEDQAAEFENHNRMFDEYVQQNAVPVEGAQELLAQLRERDVSVAIVTEGDSNIQLSKIQSLRLGSDMPPIVAVTDRTLGVLPLLEQIAHRWKETPDVPTASVNAYDMLEAYTVKARAFYCKLLHALVSSGPAGLPSELESVRFLSREEWDEHAVPRVLMVGDSYGKDVEPLLQASAHGVAAIRVLTGRYAAEDPLHEIIASGRPAPLGYFPSLSAASTTVLAVSLRTGEGVTRPVPPLPRYSDLVELAGAMPDAPPAVGKVLGEMLNVWRSSNG